MLLRSNTINTLQKIMKILHFLVILAYVYLCHFICSVLRDWRIHWNSWYSLTCFSLRWAKKGLHRGVCVCVFVADWMAQMYTLECSVWHTEAPPRRLLIYQVQFNMEYLTAHGSIQNPTPLPTYFFFQVIKRIPFLPTSSFLNVIVVDWFRCHISNTECL